MSTASRSGAARTTPRSRPRRPGWTCPSRSASPRTRSTRPSREDAFVNAQVVVTPSGKITSRYEKVRTVPFGEYVPFRGLLEALGAPLDEVPSDAVAGKTRRSTSCPTGRGSGVMISWEVFFGGRGRAATTADGTGDTSILINPTNGASYTGTVLQTSRSPRASCGRSRTGARWCRSPHRLLGVRRCRRPRVPADRRQRAEGDHDGRATRSHVVHEVRHWPWIVLLCRLAISLWYGDINPPPNSVSGLRRRYLTQGWTARARVPPRRLRFAAVRY